MEKDFRVPLPNRTAPPTSSTGGRRPIAADFSGGTITSDAGA